MTRKKKLCTPMYPRLSSRRRIADVTFVSLRYLGVKYTTRIEKTVTTHLHAHFRALYYTFLPTTAASLPPHHQFTFPMWKRFNEIIEVVALLCEQHINQPLLNRNRVGFQLSLKKPGFSPSIYLYAAGFYFSLWYSTKYEATLEGDHHRMCSSNSSEETRVQYY